MKIPSSTYRIQFHRDFTFKDLTVILEYLQSLGISTIYAAPISQATPGSMHGYDVIDPHRINPEIGTLEELESLAATLKKLGMTWIQDIVPNHMAFNTLNARLMDVLERGPSSPYYNYFDIDWNHPDADLHGKLMVPFLGEELADLVNKDHIHLDWTEQGWMVNYGENYYPLSLSCYPMIFDSSEAGQASWKTFVSEAEKCSDLGAYRALKEKFIEEVFSKTDALAEYTSLSSRINEDKNKLLNILQSQYYLLTYWKQTEQRINYRRFFTVNELICLRMEDEAVFNEYHRFIHELYQNDLIQGLRIDHIDGLNDPSMYIQRLRKTFGEDCYIIAEKILEAKEAMPTDWPLQGTSGYEFLSYVSQLMTNRKGAKQLLSFYKELVPDIPAYKELVLKNKRLILEHYMAGEWKNLVRYLEELGLASDLKHEKLKEALASLMMALPLYRIYPDVVPLTGHKLNLLRETFEKALAKVGEAKGELEYLFKLFTETPTGKEQAVLTFLKRLMQFTGPLTAKGVEDTTFYVYNPLLSHDEVGDAPSTMGISVNEFHQKMMTRQQQSPVSLNATATHDTKRGEDARLRLNVLSEWPERWIECVRKWFEVNRNFHLRTSGGIIAPTINDEYFLYQAITAGFPEDTVITEEWITRLLTYQMKALREAKMYSDWAAPDNEYENACAQFVRAILKSGSVFLESFELFIKDVINEANRTALNQLLIKVTAPGIPDIYQGCELWDLSFVDPDNRRPVDYLKRMDLLSKIQTADPKQLLEFLHEVRPEGGEKLFVCQKALNFRKAYDRLFQEGKYQPLQVTSKDYSIMSYARVHEGKWAVVVTPLQLFDHQENDLDELILPEGSPERWRNIFTGEIIEGKGRLNLVETLKTFGVAMLTNIIDQ